VLVLGWWAGLEPIRAAAPGLVSMKANTALAFILAGSSLVLLTAGNARQRRLGVGLGAAVALIGAAVIAEYLWGGFGIDQLLVHDPATSGVPGRPSPHTASYFLLCGLALVLIDVPSPRGHRPFVILVVALAAGTGLVVVGFLFGVGSLRGATSVTGIAVNTIFGMLVLTVGVALARPDREPVALLVGSTPGGALARRLLPTVILITLTLGLLRVLSARAELVGVEVGITLYALAMAATLAVAVFIACKRLDLRIEEDGATLRAVIEASRDPFIAIDDRGLVTEWNAAADKTFGWPRNVAVGRELAGLLLPERYRASHRDGMERFRATGHGNVLDQRLELEALHRDGHEVPVEITISAATSADGVSFTAFLRDISERRALEGRLKQELHSAERAAHTDELTGMPNRRGLAEHLAREVEPERRRQHSQVSTWVAMLDLDHFKQYNDLNGHRAGDHLLCEAAAAWNGALRATDFIGRYGGEEFVVVLTEMSEDEARRAVERLRGAVPEGQTCTAGIVRCEGDESIEDLLSRADRVMYGAKRAGRDRSVLTP
jgi:diguanylate cyclase (GGDEF)-like protein/PAS domain S-box-containing protein